MKPASSLAENLKNLVQTDLGKELADIVLVADWVNLPEKQLHAALLGRIGVCASCWPDFLESRANTASRQGLPEQPEGCCQAKTITSEQVASGTRMEPATPTQGQSLPNIASESLQARFIEQCSGLGLAPRQAVLLALIWQARTEHEKQLMGDAIASIIEFSPEGLPCKGECRLHKITVAPEGKE